MRVQQNGKFFHDISQSSRTIDQFYDPLKPVAIIKKSQVAPKSASFCISLFQDKDVSSSAVEPQEEDFLSTNFTKKQTVQQDTFLKKIIANSGHQKRTRNKLIDFQPAKEYQPFCFNNNIVVKYPQTPHFKNQLQSPFYKFNLEHKTHMELLKTKTIKTDFQSLPLNSDPLLFVSQSIKYFIGLALNMKQKNCIPEARMFLKLACYVEPFNERAWKKYIQFEDQHGFIYKTFILSKTAFLFTQNQEFAKQYLLNGEKCGVSLKQMRGILSSANNPDLYQKSILIELGKMHLKHKQIWKGLRVLYDICVWNQFRLAVCSLIIFLAKYLENIDQRQKGLALLKRSFSRSMSKLEIYTTYMQMKVRQEKGNLRDQVIREITDYVDCISGQNRYKLYLDIAQILYHKRDSKYKYYIDQSFAAAKKYCAPGTGCNKVVRIIYFSLLKWKNICPPLHPINDITMFQSNRHSFITNSHLAEYEFSDWKYFLHYGLIKRDDILLESFKKWSYTGRLIAEWIHCLRTKKQPSEVLRIWRQKIEQVPKSGQLWCEGGRIYAQLYEYENAIKCFKAAIHFTPQYGDSFIEQLRILLIKGKYLEIYKLKKIMLVSQPFYGHVWSFIKQSQINSSKLCMSQMWDIAIEHLKLDLYKQEEVSSKTLTKNLRLLTAFQPYNQAYINPNTEQIRKKLFASYQQLENKN